MKQNKTNASKIPATALLVLVACLALMIMLHLATLLFGPSKSQCSGQVCLQHLLDGPPAFNNAYLARLLQNKYMTQPSGKEYNLSGFNGKDQKFTEVLEAIKKHFNHKKNGVFVHLGAGDGEFRDLTLPLERDQAWTGLLVEPNNELFAMLKQKQRKSQMANLCISPFPYSLRVKFGYPKVSDSASVQTKVRALRQTKVAQLYSANETEKITVFSQQCIPLENVIYAAKLGESIDLLVFDMSQTDLIVCSFSKLEQLPVVKMAVVISDGVDFSEDISYYFLDLNLEVTRIIGEKSSYHVYILTTPVAQPGIY